MVDKHYCMSSFLTLRYVDRKDKVFKKNLEHTLDIPYPENKKILVSNAKDVAKAYKHFFSERQKKVKLGILLSGGMDSACLAAFLKPGTDAYTFKFLNKKANVDLERAKKYAKKYKLKLHIVPITFSIIKKHLKPLMINKGAPVHSIEPQIMEACLQSKKDGVEQMVAADGSDLVFGGMDKMLSREWLYKDWIKFYTFLDPKLVLKNPVDMEYIFRRYKKGRDKIDYLKFIDDIFAHESSGSYCNATITAKMKYTPLFDPSAYVKVKGPLDLNRIRKGESKYIIRDLFKMCYPEFEIPEKIPMPRDVDLYFKNWKGPKRKEFKQNINMSKLTGNQKWLLFSLEYFLNALSIK